MVGGEEEERRGRGGGGGGQKGEEEEEIRIWIWILRGNWWAREGGRLWVMYIHRHVIIQCIENLSLNVIVCRLRRRLIVMAIVIVIVVIPACLQTTSFSTKYLLSREL